jgi:ribonuclease-3
MVIARALYERHPDEPEGNLSKRYNALVDRETCAENGREIGVPALVRLGKQAREDGASQSENVVGDVVEALIGALYLDGGMEAAERFILKTWEPDVSSQRRAPQHPKSALQELAAAKGVRAPAYDVVARTGAHHTPKFTVRVSVPKLGEATADGTSKQEAETAAAAALLSQLK